MGCCCPLSWTPVSGGAAEVSWLIPCSSSPQIKESENEHPDEVDEVPVKARDLDRRIVSRLVVIAAQHLGRDDQQYNDPDAHVEPVEAGYHEEACPELRCSH